MKKLQNKTNVTAPNGTYPYGDLKDNPGDNTGTPVDKELLTDVMQLMEKVVDESGITVTGLPDNDANGYDLFKAFSAVFTRTKQVEIGAWDMDADATFSQAHGLDVTKIRSVDILIGDDNLPFTKFYKLDSDPGLTGQQQGGISSIDATNINMERLAAGFFDSTSFDLDTGSQLIAVRGYINITYVL